ncbi:phosphoethanolamine transferase [Thalassolituus oleivorans]|uniref:phosphoethanolamine transferase n=1 Tax=Thalassolituus oleivorans TaxID=187493 RepID=UPI002409D83F|nr:phosphoethanolamine transferase [Thalassolituus oleivorans]MDF1639464.1 sulfatase-like hydrolase/transferase [Thalassolituus oleivorans]
MKIEKLPEILRNPLLWSLIVLLYPLLHEVVFSDFVREGEYNSRIGWSFISAFLITLGNRRWITAIVLFPFLLGGICDIGYAYSFGGVFTTATMEAVAYTDQYEVIEYINTYSTWQLTTILTAFLLLYCAAVYCCKKPESLKTQRVIFVLGSILIIVMVYRTTVMGKFHDTIPGILGTLPSYHLGSISLQKEVEIRRDMLDSTKLKAVIKDKTNSQTHIFIIGESATRNHMGIYGYERDTTPRLSSLKNELVILDNVISSHVQTQASLRVALTAAKGVDGDDYRESPSIIDIANIAGYKTFWISNQQPQRATIASISHQAKVTHYISNDFNGVEVRRFDEYMLDSIKKAIEDPAPFKSIFIHMMGSHASYENRYPEAFDQFKDQQANGYKAVLDDREVDAINAYDNSILYSDYFVSEVISLLKKSDSDSKRTLTYFSDHGEEVFQAADIKGHTPDNLTKNMLEIPFIVWASDRDSDDIAILNKNSHRPFMLDGLFSYALTMLNISSDMLSVERSPASNDFKAPLKRKVYKVTYEEAFPNNGQNIQRKLLESNI